MGITSIMVSTKNQKKKKTSGRQQMAQVTYEDAKFKSVFEWGNGEFELLEQKKIDVVHKLAEKLEKAGMHRELIMNAIAHMCKKYVSRGYLSMVLGEDFKQMNLSHKRASKVTGGTEGVGVTEIQDEVAEEAGEEANNSDIIKRNAQLERENAALHLEVKTVKAQKTVALDKGWVLIPRSEFDHVQSIMRTEPKGGRGVYVHFNPDHEMDQVLLSEVFERQYKDRTLKDVVYN